MPTSRYRGRHGRAALLAGAVLAAAALAGCGGPPRSQVRGVVTLDGQPLPGGMIEFRPEALDGPTAGGGINPDGTYDLPDVSVGRMVVCVEANRVTGKRKLYNTPDSPTADVVVNYLPERYNRKSELRVDLKPGANECNFDLKSKP